MSYLRSGSVLKYVEGKSEDYVFPTSIKKGKKWINFIEDYGDISDSGFIELLFEYWDTKDKMFKEHLLKRLAKRLKVKLRKKPLTDKQIMKYWGKVK